MKKFLSVFIAMLLIVSLFATTAVAFAEESGEPATGETTTTPTEGEENEEEEETPRDPITFECDILNSSLAEGCSWFNNLKIEMGDVKFGGEMMKSGAKVRLAFKGIKYVGSDEEDYDTEKSKNDKIYVEYCRPSESPKGQEAWQNSALITDNIRISSSGWYLFRFVVKDSENNVLATSNSDNTSTGENYYLRFYAEDTSRPVVALSSTMKTKMENGLTAGAKYSIPTSGLTSGSTDEMSSTTVNFKVYKVVNDKDVLIYDSSKSSDKVTEGYEAFVDNDGAITPSNDDISDKTVYKVVYSVKDAYGFTGVENKSDIQKYDASLEFNPVMELKVVAAPVVKTDNAVNVWEIVLFSIAGLSAIGIVVLLCIKPKEATASSRVAPVNDQQDEEVSADETQE